MFISTINNLYKLIYIWVVCISLHRQLKTQVGHCDRYLCSLHDSAKVGKGYDHRILTEMPSGQLYKRIAGNTWNVHREVFTLFKINPFIQVNYI